MKLKRFALKGLIVLAVVVALCMFFARTVQTITTPKVQLVTGTTGKFEQDMDFSAQVDFPETEEIVLEDAAKSSITVEKLYVQPGHWVEEGETIFTARMPSYEEDMKKLQDSYQEKAQSLLELDLTNRKYSKESKQNELYDTLVAAQDDLSEATYQARITAMKAGITLPSDMTDWKKQLAALDDVPKEVSEAVDKAIAAQGTVEAARSALYAIYEDRKQRVSSDVFKYINDRNKLIAEMDELQQDMVQLEARHDALAKVTAPRAGYIVSLGVSAGDTYDGSKAAYVLSGKDSAPMLKASLSNVTRTISEGMKVTIESDNYGKEKTTVAKVGVDSTGEKYMLINLPDSMSETGSAALRKAISEGVQVSITYRAKKATTLLPASAVRNAGENSDYVYLIQRDYGGLLSSSSMKVVKTSVHVLERGEKVVSVEDDLSYQQVADKEDRELSDGQKVMEYVN